MKLSDVSDQELLSRMGTLLGSERRVLASLLAHLSEVEERRLDVRSAHGSIFDFCIHRLGLSESETYLRVTAARLARRYPHILERIEAGQIHFSALALLRNHITDANHEELIAMACGRTKREVQSLLAARFPRPDVPTRIRKLPRIASAEANATGAPSADTTSADRGDAGAISAGSGSSAAASATPSGEPGDEPTDTAPTKPLLLGGRSSRRSPRRDTSCR